MNKTYAWWRVLCAVSVMNILIWLWVCWWQFSDAKEIILQLGLSGIYVIICAFRSFLPRIDLERYCLYDTPLSSILLGRSCATVAEICFSIQCALLLFSLGSLLDSSLITGVSYFVVPIIVIAQMFCWYAALTLNHFWHGMEESAWVVMIVLACGSFMVAFQSVEGVYQTFMIVGVMSCLGSLYIMLFVDIPMYFGRRDKGLKTGLNYLSVKKGLEDAYHRRVQTSDWCIWKKEVLWITSYFTIGVWLSISMVVLEVNYF